MANLELLAEEFRKEGYTEHNAGNQAGQSGQKSV
jgi:hypothetical protein